VPQAPAKPIAALRELAVIQSTLAVDDGGTLA